MDNEHAHAGNDEHQEHEPQPGIGAYNGGNGCDFVRQTVSETFGARGDVVEFDVAGRCSQMRHGEFVGSSFHSDFLGDGVDDELVRNSRFRLIDADNFSMMDEGYLAFAGIGIPGHGVHAELACFGEGGHEGVFAVGFGGEDVFGCDVTRFRDINKSVFPGKSAEPGRGFLHGVGQDGADGEDIFSCVVDGGALDGFNDIADLQVA